MHLKADTDLPPTVDTGFTFTLNGHHVAVNGVAPSTTLLDFLRNRNCTGSKQGCNEGDCGACSVALVDRDGQGRVTYRAVNSCLTLMPMLAGREVISVEGVAAAGLHPIQQKMIQCNGSQCGYCTPGFILSLMEGYYRNLKTPTEIADQLCGNLCRCTGYRSIREAAAEAFAIPIPGDDPFRMRLAQPLADLAGMGYTAAGHFFQRPSSLEELFELQQKFPHAVLIAGGTEIGVDINKKGKPFPHLISTEAVPELQEITRTDTHWHIGAAASLTRVEESLEGEYPALDKMWRVFASRQIRNRATLGGNLATASPIGDSAPVLLSLDASMVLSSPTGDREIPLSEFFTGYRQTVLQPGELIRAVRIPRLLSNPDTVRHIESFKVSKRREMDISIMSAAFFIETNSAGIIREARLAFGGVAITSVRATRTEAFLIQKPWTQKTAGEALAILRGEFKPIDDVRAHADYRENLIVDLWMKFATGDLSASQDEPCTFTPSPTPEIPDTSRALNHESARGHVTGSAQYVDDTAHRRNMLEIWPVCAPHAHARILRRDTTVARSMPGVAAIYMAEDIPGWNDVGAVRHDEPLFADTEVLYHGHMIAVVVGESLAACKAAAAAVEAEYEPLTPILSIEEAVAAESYHTDPMTMARGDAEAGLATSTNILEGDFFCGGQEHFYLETHAAWAESDDQGGVFISCSTQHPTEIQTVVSHVLHIPRNMIVVQSPRMGGGFGGKETQGNTWAALVALAAVKTGRPVRVQLDRDIDMILTGKRHPFQASFRVGYDSEGKIQAARVDLIADGGWSLDLSMPICDRALFHLDNAYYIPNAHFTGRVAKTHVASNTAFRGFGGPQGMLVMEEIMARIARRLGRPPEEVRASNFYHGTGETSTTHYGQLVEHNRIPKIWPALLQSSEFKKRRTEIIEWNKAHPMIKRGIAITPVKFGISFTLTHYNQAGALVLAYLDGTLQVNHGGTEMGQGLHTKILGVAMRELGLPDGQIRLMHTRTDKVPNTAATAASSGADLNGAAVQDACIKLRERLRPVAAQLIKEATNTEIEQDQVIFQDGGVSVSATSVAIPFATVVQRAYVDRINLSSAGFYRTPDIHWDRSKGKGKPFHYFAFGAAVSEVEVDGYTGMNTLRRVDILHDVGDSLNPGVDRGQIEGGFVQGMGWLTREQLKWDKTGRLLTRGASTYAIPAFSDAPADFRVTLLPDAATTNTIHGSKAVGEPPLMLAISVREALRDAVSAFGTDSGEFELGCPSTNEAVHAAVRKRLAFQKIL